jgi:hypothetical protein
VIAPLHVSGDAGAEVPHAVEAFGLRVEADWPLAGAAPAASGAFGRPATTVRRVEPEELARAWEAPGERLFERPFRGEIAITFERADDYRIRAKGFGRYVVTADGTQVQCERGIPGYAQERFLFSTVLPLAAVLQGFELLHASAVSLDGVAVAFAGPAGSGKTTLATALVADGAELVTDDALALQLEGGRVVAHPGPPYVAVADWDGTGLVDVVERIGQVVGKSDKVGAVVPTVRGSRPLGAVCHLEEGPALELAPLGVEVAPRLLGSASVPYVVTPDRLERQFHMAHLLATTVPQLLLRVPRAVDAHDIVAAIETHLREESR